LPTLHLDDPQRASLKSAARAAIVMPAVFAVAEKVIQNPQTSIFAAFGSFAMLVLVEFTGPVRSRFVAYVVLVADQVVDPADELKDRLDKVRQLTLAEWKEQRDEVADGIAKLLAGIDAKKTEKVREKVFAILNQARTLKEEDYAKKRPGQINVAALSRGGAPSSTVDMPELLRPSNFRASIQSDKGRVAC